MAVNDDGVGWAIAVLQEAGAILECEEQDRADPHARQHALDVARRDPQPTCHRKRPRRRSPRCLTRSATLARSVRRKTRAVAVPRFAGSRLWLVD